MKKILALSFATLLLFSPLAASANGYGGSMKDAPAQYCPSGAFSGYTVGLVGAVADHDVDFDAEEPGAWRDSFSDSGRDGAIGYISGYNYQCGSFVIGYEGDTSWSWLDHSASHSFEGDTINISHEIDWLSTFRGRVGVTLNDRWLVYFTGGAARAKIKHEISTPGGAGGSVSFKDNRWGYVLGGGVELASTERLMIKAEGLYIKFSDEFGSSQLYGWRQNFNFEDELVLARIGVSYKLARSPLSMLFGR